VRIYQDRANRHQKRLGVDDLREKTAITNRIIRVILEDANRTEFIDSAAAENHRHVGDIAAV
jgi:hypothetical protein